MKKETITVKYLLTLTEVNKLINSWFPEILERDFIPIYILMVSQLKDQWYTLSYLSVFSLNAGKYGLEKLRIRALYAVTEISRANPG